MTTEFDPKKSYLTLKAHEKMIAYVGFRVQPENDDRGKEGVIKISIFHRPYGGSQLTLTFIVDLEGDTALKHLLDGIFTSVTTDALRPKMGRRFEKLNKVSLGSLAHTTNWYVEEITLHFGTLAERENVIVEELLLPALQSLLPFSFDPVEWWPDDVVSQSLIGKEISARDSVRSIFRKWFSLG